MKAKIGLALLLVGALLVGGAFWWNGKYKTEGVWNEKQAIERIDTITQGHALATAANENQNDAKLQEALRQYQQKQPQANQEFERLEGQRKMGYYGMLYSGCLLGLGGAVLILMSKEE
ncbi:MAG: hypothetical protein R3C28_21945 [Pirellulaceae bacterium]